MSLIYLKLSQYFNKIGNYFYMKHVEIVDIKRK